MSLAEQVRRHDPDRYFCALFAPEAAREALFTLYAFNHELARAREAAREPGLALIRLQWWREVVEGAVRQHEVALPLRALIESGRLPVAPLLAMIDMRDSQATEAADTMQEFIDLMRRGQGALAQAAGAALGLHGDARLAELGAAYGVTGTWRNVPALAKLGRCDLPLDVLEAAGLSPEAAIADPHAAMAAAWPAFRQVAESLLGKRRGVARAALAAALPAVFARRDVARAALAQPRGAADRLAVLWAALNGVI